MGSNNSLKDYIARLADSEHDAENDVLQLEKIMTNIARESRHRRELYDAIMKELLEQERQDDFSSGLNQQSITEDSREQITRNNPLTSTPVSSPTKTSNVGSGSPRLIQLREQIAYAQPANKNCHIYECPFCSRPIKVCLCIPLNPENSWKNSHSPTSGKGASGSNTRGNNTNSSLHGSTLAEEKFSFNVTLDSTNNDTYASGTGSSTEQKKISMNNLAIVLQELNMMRPVSDGSNNRLSNLISPKKNVVHFDNTKDTIVDPSSSNPGQTSYRTKKSNGEDLHGRIKAAIRGTKNTSNSKVLPLPKQSNLTKSKTNVLATMSTPVAKFQASKPPSKRQITQNGRSIFKEPLIEDASLGTYANENTIEDDKESYSEKSLDSSRTEPFAVQSNHYISNNNNSIVTNNNDETNVENEEIISDFDKIHQSNFQSDSQVKVFKENESVNRNTVSTLPCNLEKPEDTNNNPLSLLKRIRNLNFF